MTMLTKRKALAYKLEAVEGTAETLTAAEVIYAEDIKFTPNIEGLRKNPHLTTLSDLAPVAGRSTASVNFKCLAYGGSAAGTAPFWGGLLQACAFAETIVATTSVTYKPASSSIKTITIKIFEDGIAYLLKGCRGTVSGELTAGNIPVLNFIFEGLFDPATDTSAIVDTATLVGNAFPAFDPKPFKSALLTVGGSYKAITESLKWDIANKIQKVPDSNISNFKRCDIVDRNPKGEMDAEAVTRATYDFWDKLTKKTAVAIDGFIGADDTGTGTGTASTMTDSTKSWATNQWAGYKLRDVNGVVYPIASNTATALTVTGTPATGVYVIYQAGKLIEVSMPKCVFDNINDGDKGGIYNFGLPFGIYMNTGDDEISIICT